MSNNIRCTPLLLGGKSDVVCLGLFWLFVYLFWVIYVILFVWAILWVFVANFKCLDLFLLRWRKFNKNIQCNQSVIRVILGGAT